MRYFEKLPGLVDLDILSMYLPSGILIQPFKAAFPICDCLPASLEDNEAYEKHLAEREAKQEASLKTILDKLQGVLTEYECKGREMTLEQLSHTF